MRARTIPFKTGAVTQTKLVLPEHWANYLINGDMEYLDSLDPVERHAAKQVVHLYGHCVDAEDDAAFVIHHDALADGVLPCNCATFAFVEMH